MTSPSRRRFLRSGLAAAAGLSGLAIAERIARRYGLVPPDAGGWFGPSETLTYASQRLLLAHQPLAREFSRADITRTVPVNGDVPFDDTYQALLAGGFDEWRLDVDGLVARPTSISLAELMRLPAHSHITMQACEEGWSFIAEWTGVRLSDLLARVGASPQARYVVFFPFDDIWDSLDMADALHPQTLLAYSMNGSPLAPSHGAPLRVRVTRQLGYKSVKYLSRITVTDSLANIRDGRGSVSPSLGYSWYAGI
jgi:DMSO/TMAO reductase YedYZ molybdopterin-dependent catalytic subunit